MSIPMILDGSLTRMEAGIRKLRVQIQSPIRPRDSPTFSCTFGFRCKMGELRRDRLQVGAPSPLPKACTLGLPRDQNIARALPYQQSIVPAIPYVAVTQTSGKDKPVDPRE